MNQKQIGAIVIIFGIILAGFVYFAKLREDKIIAEHIKEAGSCYLTDGTCLHEDRSFTLYVIGWTISAALIILGIYLAVFDKTQKILFEQQREVSFALKEAKEQDTKKDEFKAFISGFNVDEQKILLAVHEQEGIQQSTLRYKTGVSKTSLSLLLKSLEEREIISRRVSGKTNLVYLVKKF